MIFETTITEEQLTDYLASHFESPFELKLIGYKPIKVRFVMEPDMVDREQLDEVN